MSAAKIVINGHFLRQQVTGVQQYTREILHQFDEQGRSYRLITPSKKIRSDVLRQLWIQSIMPFKIPDDAALWSPTNIGPVFNSRHLITLHDIADQLFPQLYDRKYVVWRKFILPKLLHRVRKILTVSNYSRQSILDYFPQAEGKIRVIYPGIRTDFFYPRDENEIEKVRRSFNLEKPFLLMVSSLDARKNISGLVDAWQLLPDKIHRQMNLVITGGEAKKFTFSRGKNLDKSIRFTGYVEKQYLPALYSAAMLFVYPSFFEGFGSPPLEALACGTAVLTSNTTALKETSGPAAGVNPRNIEDIRDAMLCLIESPAERSRIANEGQEWVKRFSWQQCAAEIYEELAQAG